MLGRRIVALALCSLLSSAAAVAQSSESNAPAAKAIETAAAEISPPATTTKAAPATSGIQTAAAAADAAAEPAAESPPVGEAAPAAKPAEPAAPLGPPTLTVSINLASQNMVVSENGSVKYSWPISSGTAEFPTPRGTFRPQWSAKMWYSRKYDMAPMPHAVFIHGGVAVHATQHVSRLGSPASHGCIRLAPGNARTFYNLVHRHGMKMTRVSIHGTPKYRAPAMASRKKATPQQYAQNTGDWWFSGPSYSKPVSAYDPRFAKNQRLRKVQAGENVQGKRVYYRTASGQLVQVQRPPKVAKYGGYSNSGW